MSLVALVLLCAVPSGGAAVSGPLAFTVTITDTPSPTDPYLITFSATVGSGTPTLYNWSFGDGTQPWTGSSPSYAQPAHRFAGPGNFNVTLTIFEGAASVSQWIIVNLSANALHALITVNTATGVVPLTVSFSGVVSGGSGTYRSMTWNFGDGRGSGSGITVMYTYSGVGSFHVTFDVTDSSNHSASAQTWINTTSADQGPASPFGDLAATGPVIAVILVGFVAVIALGLWLGLRRTPATSIAGGGSEDFEDTVEVPDAAAPAPTPTPPAPVGIPPSSPSVPIVTAAPPASPQPTEIPPPLAAVVPPPEPSFPIAPPKMHVAPEALRVSQRIVLHLASLGTLGHDEIAPVGFTQIGMSEVLGVRQNALTNVLRRLVAANVVAEDVRHVRGQPRRLKVYRLTSRGELLARDLRHTHGRPRAPPTPSRGSDDPDE